jgi:hypothetical protein
MLRAILVGFNLQALDSSELLMQEAWYRFMKVRFVALKLSNTFLDLFIVLSLGTMLLDCQADYLSKSKTACL